MSISTRRLASGPLGTALFLVALLAVTASSAHAEGDPLAGGTTELTLKGLGKAFERSGVRLVARRPAKASGETATLPVKGGEIDPTTGKGVVIDEGGIGFARGKRHLVLSSVRLDTERRLLTGKLGGKTMTVASARRISFVRVGYGTRIAVGNLKLSGRFAKRLDSRLRVRFFKSGRAFARATSETEPLTVLVIPIAPGIHGGGIMYLSPTDEAVSKLAAKGVMYPKYPCPSYPCPFTVSLFGNAQTFGTGIVTMGFRIVGGRIAPDFSMGEIISEGGIRVATNDPEVNPAILVLKDISLDLTTEVVTADVEFQPSPPAPGDVGRVTIGTLDRDGITLPGRGKEVFDAVRLTTQSASVINQVFPGPASAAFSAGEVLFSLSYTPGTR